MAPVPRRPPPTPLILRPTLVAPSTPVPVTSFIPRKLFLQLFAGTICIFIVTVLFWRFPSIVRFFTKNKVLRQGNAATARYAKTWYGWVSSQRHESNKCALRNFMAKLSNWVPWRSSRADFQWVWWDHRNQKLGPCRDGEEGTLSKWERGYGFVPPDIIWNPERVSSDGMEMHSRPRPPVARYATGALLPPEPPQPTISSRMRATRTSLSLQEWFGSTFPARYPRGHRRPRTDFSYDFGSHPGLLLVPHINKRLKLLRQLPHDRGPNRVSLTPALNHHSLPQSFSTPCLSQLGHFSPPRVMSSYAVCKSESAGSDNFPSGSLAMLQRSRRYQVWSARMGLLTLKCLGYSTHTLPRGPPGTPQSALLGSFSIGHTSGGQVNQYCHRIKGDCPSDISDLSLGSGDHLCSRGRLASAKGHKLKNYAPDGQLVSSLSVSSSQPLPPVLQPPDKNLHTDRTNSAGEGPTQEGSNTERNGRCIVQFKDWSNWEVRLMDNLDRKLEWLSDQLSPGKRTFHFALLANHWLNTETWIVYDPISRVSIDARRRLGDPRFNVPYPKPQWNPQPKYPKVQHRLAHTPNINAWRAAMNQNRTASGLRKFIKSIELYDSSAEDPPDGMVDPASWVIRKPPQGVSLSARQMETYYEGGTGWQEKLSDWQKIRRGYRVQKAIHEGRVNRTRAKEIVYGLTRYYQRTSSRLLRPESSGEYGVEQVLTEETS
ncbi:hypothetical protein ASPCAL05955 [Aspergillus calidoustus]|uniref:Uncharacterized protein n=1 Tax=Aspergillus calidoustus TaxID=454130 RepID=A0A0U5G5L3_ASPCI|nr:hypothetical protein ASPCAL05955 [Aspergillus calidoustus]